MKTTISAVLFSILMATASSSFASDNYSGDQVSDGDVIMELLARPLGLVGAVVGGAIHIIGLPFSVTGENSGEVAEVMVERPLHYTFNRPLGHFDDETY